MSPVRRSLLFPSLFLASFAFAVLLPGLAGAASVETGLAAPSGLNRVEGSFLFGPPAEVDAEIDLPAFSIAHWPLTGHRSAPPVAGFEAHANEVTAMYRERPLLLPDDNQSKPSFAIYYGVTVSLTPQASPQELVAMAADPFVLPATSTEWALSTRNPAEPLAATGGNPFMRPPSPSATPPWDLRLEGERLPAPHLNFTQWYFYGFNVTLQHRDGIKTYTTGLWDASGHLPINPGVHTTPVESYLLLTADSIVTEFDLGDRPVQLLAPELTLSGRFAFEDVHGQLSTPFENHHYDRDPVSLHGSFLLAAPARDADDAGSGRHKITLTGLAEGFTRPAVEAAAPAPVNPVLGWSVAAALALTGLLFAAWKPLTALFTRLKPDELLADPARRRIYDAITANPGITVNELSQLESTTPKNIRYHVGVLRRFRRLRAFRLHGAWHWAAADQDAARLEQQLLLSTDPKLESLVRHLGTQALPASQLVRHLRQEWGVSRSGAWYLIDRAVASRLVAKELQGHSVILRGTTPSPAPAAESNGTAPS